MGQRHWLDPLARRLLKATGQLPSSPLPAAPAPAATCVERDLLEMRLRQQPGCRLRNAQEVQLAAELGWRLDVNRATAADWMRLPGISADQVDLLMRLQAGGVQLSGADDLQRLLELPAAVVASWQPLLDYRWYGEAPTPAGPARVDLNQAAAPVITALGLSPQRCQRLLRERARRPFADLADLQQRLQLPAALIERLIGRVCFSPGMAGPSLPLPQPRR
jgi:DNA uptake protein ComE-like DNA-binding protein